MATTEECRTVEDLRRIVGRERGWSGAALNSIKVEHYAYDPRIDWHCYIVTGDGGVIGFADGPLPAATERIEQREGE